jgi:transcription antitermination protein NusB
MTSDGDAGLSASAPTSSPRGAKAHRVAPDVMRQGRDEYGEDLRTEARERALSVLYEAFAKGDSPIDVIRARVVPADAMTHDLVEGVVERGDEIDALLADHAKGWTLARMAVLDRSVLRLGVFELIGRASVPTAVILNEAVEMANRFGTDDSGKFVNGVLAAVARTVRPGTTSAAPIKLKPLRVIDVEGEPGSAPVTVADSDDDEFDA